MKLVQSLKYIALTIDLVALTSLKIFHPSRNASLASSWLNGDKLFEVARDRVKC